MVLATTLQPLMTSTSVSQDDMMGTLIQTIRQEIRKTLLQASQTSQQSRSSSTNGRSVRFDSPGPNRQSISSYQNQNYRNQTNSNNNNNRYNINQNNRCNNSHNQENNIQKQSQNTKSATKRK